MNIDDANETLQKKWCRIAKSNQIESKITKGVNKFSR